MPGYAPRLRAALCGVVAGVALLGAAPAGAAELPAHVRVAQEIVVVLVVEDGTAEALDTRSEAPIRAHVRALPARLVIEGKADRGARNSSSEIAAESVAVHGAVGAFWIQSSGPGRARLFLRTEAGDTYVHAVESTDGEAAAEAIGLVVADSTRALVAGEPVGMERISIPAPQRSEPAVKKTAAPAPAKPRERGRLRVAAAYTGTSYAPEVPWQQGLDLGVGWVFPFRLHLGLGYAVLAPARASRDYGTIEVRRHPARAWAGYSAQLGRVRIDADVPIIVDAETRHAQASDPDYASRPDTTRVVVGTGVQTRVAVTLTRGLFAFVGGGVELWPQTIEYGAQEPAPQALLRPRTWRGSGSVGLAVRL